MNISELARQLKITTQELKDKLPELGFHVGQRAIQIPDQQAAGVIKAWQEYKQQEEKHKRLEQLQEKLEKKEVVTDKSILLPATITVHELAKRIKTPVVKLIQQLINNGILASINENLDFEIAAIVLEQFGFKAKKQDVGQEEEKEDTANREKLKEIIFEHHKNKGNLQLKPPVVVVMGHIDHGKTSLLDYIRQTQIAVKEAGAITQHIGAYQVTRSQTNADLDRRQTQTGAQTNADIQRQSASSPRKSAPAYTGRRTITFIDTPGHEAFKVMRGRGGQVADLAILVVAADDGVKDQTIESLKIIQKEELPFIVAINKIDKPEARPDNVKKELSALNVIPEDWGGKTACQSVSAKNGQGVDDLLDLILLMADMEKEKLSADYSLSAVGTIIEAHLDTGEGPVATVIIHDGTLKKEDSILIGQVYGKIRALKDWLGHDLETATPGMPVKIIGLNSLPKIGDILEVKTEKDLKEIKKKLKTQKHSKVTTGSVSKEEDKDKKSLTLVAKADVSGSLEALIEMIKKTEIPEIKVKIIKSGLGPISEIDVVMGEKSKGLVVGFNVDLTSEAKKCALEKGVRTFVSRIIYEVVDEIKKEIKNIKGKTTKEVASGRLKILMVFRKESGYSIVGGKVLEGKISMRNKVRVWRDKDLVGEGEVGSLQSNKTEVNEVGANSECGLKYRGSEEIKVGDIFELYREERA